MNLETNHRTTGFLVLLLTLLTLHSLKPTLTNSRPHRSTGEGDLFIQVGGEVKFPGVYAFSYRPNLAELIGKAGGLSSDTIFPEIFKDFTFSSGKKVTVRQEGNDTKFCLSEMSAFYKTTLGIRISLNGESETGLTALPGIGLGLAKAIVQERSKRGGFKNVDEVLSINGIGPKLYRNIKPYLTL
jgi:competence protein ComEA